MNDKDQKPKFKLFEKLKNVKHIEIYIAIIFVVIVLLIYFSTSNKKTKSSVGGALISSELTVSAYIDDMESNLSKVLSSINGVSDVNVMITLDIKEAQIQDSKINLTTFPDIKGVIITAKGVSNTIQKMKVLHAVEAVLDVKNGNIEILSSD